MYVPFAALADATLDTTVFGRTVLVATLASGGEVRIKLANGNPFDVLGAVMAHVGERRSGGTALQPGHPAFERGDAALGAWLESVRRDACGAEAYRAAPAPRELLAALLDDEGGAVSQRAAAAHALLALGADEDLATVARALVSRAMPPLVLVAAALAPGGAALVDDDLLVEMGRLLPAGDRDAFAGMTMAGMTMQRSDPARAARVAAALVIAKQLASDEVHAATAEGQARAGTRRALHPVSSSSGASSNAGRWVGRSWGL